MHEQIFNILMKEDEITWQNMLFEVVKHENMDPWDIDISRLTQMYIEMLKKMQTLNLKVSGKVLLASALLLRYKSTKFIGEDILEFDRLMSGEEDELLDEDSSYETNGQVIDVAENRQLYPRMPQPRKRKVSIYDLVEALQQAMVVNQRRFERQNYEIEIPIPEKRIDITKKIEEIYNIIKEHPETDKILFSKLVPEWEREAIVYTFIPLLHLSQDRKIDLLQEEHFGDIEIKRLNNFANKS